MSDRLLRSVRSTRALVDTCVLLDILTVDPQWSEWSAVAVADARDIGELAINPIIYAEVAGGFDQIEDLNAALPSDFVREPLPYQAGFLAAKAFADYRRRGGTRHAPLSDFYIGAHAMVNGYPLITRDTSRFRTYFPGLELVTPN